MVIFERVPPLSKSNLLHIVASIAGFPKLGKNNENYIEFYSIKPLIILFYCIDTPDITHF